jgi:hypothetical protein
MMGPLERLMSKIHCISYSTPPSELSVALVHHKHLLQLQTGEKIALAASLALAVATASVYSTMKNSKAPYTLFKTVYITNC